MNLNTSAIIALVVAILVFLAVYYWGGLTAMAAVAIAAIVGLILQGILIGSLLNDIRRGPLDETLWARAGGFGFYALMALIYVLIIFITLIIYAVRDRRVVVVVTA